MLNKVKHKTRLTIKKKKNKIEKYLNKNILNKAKYKNQIDSKLESKTHK